MFVGEHIGLPGINEERMFKSRFEVADQLLREFPLSVPVQVQRIKKEFVACFELWIVIEKDDVAIGGGKARED